MVVCCGHCLARLRPPSHFHSFFTPKRLCVTPFCYFFSRLVFPAFGNDQANTMILPRNDFPDDSAGDAGGTTAPGVQSGTEGGASGSSGSAVSISTGGLVAIVVIVVVVAILGSESAPSTVLLNSSPGHT